ncbi:MAG: outer membrane beta-barrel domain-containing protein [Bdellovibrionales bacterium]|nr:outer membrane beta-barrel domain-containing protein [Bdellovibrionales bacterium]
MNPHNATKHLGLLLTAAAVTAASAQAAPAKKGPTPRDVEVDNVKEAYWNRTSDGDIEVVQNRQYSKKHRLSIAANFGTVSADPFLSVKSTSGALSFHFTESLAVTGVLKKFIVSDSSYNDELKSGLVTGTPSIANTNRPDIYYGGEIAWSPLYGKISLSGASIVHYDAHLLASAGITKTESGNYFTPGVGFGPQFYLSNSLALRLDYRLAMYKETIPERVLTTRPDAGSRTNWSHQVALGVEVFL